jgi:hypothetical protein
MVKVLVAAVFIVFALLLSTQASAVSSVTTIADPRDGLVELSIDSSTISLAGLSFRLPDQGDPFTVSVENIEPDEEWVYDYFIVDAAGLYGNPESIFFEVKISRDWIDENYVETNTIALSIYDPDEEEWETATTVKFSEDDEFFYYRAGFPRLEALFAVTGTPNPFDIKVTRNCNGNDICEPELGEDKENCHDCFGTAADNVCIPSRRTCLNDNVMICSDDGRDYRLEPCDFACSEGECVDQPSLPVAGMIVAANPLYLSVIALLSSVIAYLAFSLRRMRETLSRVEKLAGSQEDIRALARGRERESD